MPDKVSIIINNWTTLSQHSDFSTVIRQFDRNLLIGEVYHFITDTLFNLDHGINKYNKVTQKLP